ncbi:MAG TPA: heavy-metal-associated domain-containing protein [Nocardioides sp.]|nr:heavy-metal-associated domain-containing protein [Nocardioides sp.]
MDTQTYTVTGMTCGHCAASVTEEISAIAGVEGVDVVVETGAVTVTSTTPLDESAVRAAVEEAGYALASDDLVRERQRADKGTESSA